MSAGKLLTEWGVMVEAEASYGAGATMVAAEDGLLVLERPDVDLDYAHDGQRRGQSGPMSHGIKRVGKSGLFGVVPLIHEAHGAGAAYSASVVPSMHDILVACGMTATVDTTLGSEKYDYTPGSGTSVGIELYNLEQKYILKGCYSDLSISADGAEVPVWEFGVQGLGTIPTEASVPAITYPNVIPPKATNISLALGDFASAVVRGFTFNLNREIAARFDQNSGGHKGFSLGGCAPSLETVIEAATLVGTPFHSSSGLDAYSLSEAATALGLSLQIGSVQYNKWKITASNAQIADVDEGDDGPSGLWTITWNLMPSGPGAKDNFTITAD